uniref:Uncharacterized protein n=1 Tax=Fusarium oxysporum (strain Fo5176) TaxID=660025 RepID=A0A0C4DIP5_FUSOF
MIKSCKGDLASFTRRVGRIRKNLEIQLTQIESMMAWLKEGKSLVMNILFSDLVSAQRSDGRFSSLRASCSTAACR